jgi:hypothetical protein
MAPAFADANQFNGPRHSFFLLLQNLQLQVFFYLILLVCVANAPLGKIGSFPSWEPHQPRFLSMEGVWPTVLTPFKANNASVYVLRNMDQVAEPKGSNSRLLTPVCPTTRTKEFIILPVNITGSWPRALPPVRADTPYVVRSFSYIRALLCILCRLGFRWAYCPASPPYIDNQSLQKSGLFTILGGSCPHEYPYSSIKLRLNLSVKHSDGIRFHVLGLSLGGAGPVNFRLKGWPPYSVDTQIILPSGLVFSNSPHRWLITSWDTGFY